MSAARHLVWLGAGAAIGVAVGAMVDAERPARGGLVGAAAGLIAGALLGELQRRASGNGDIGFYSASSPLYEESDELGYI